MKKKLSIKYFLDEKFIYKIKYIILMFLSFSNLILIIKKNFIIIFLVFNFEYLIFNFKNQLYVLYFLKNVILKLAINHITNIK